MTENNPMRISVILPVHNAEKTLSAAAESALAQTLAPAEILLIDDGSADESGALCDTLAARHDTVQAVHLAHGGVSRARNEGLRRASGEGIAFLDADDAMHPRMLETLAALLIREGAQIAACGHGETKTGQTARVYTGEEYAERGVLCADTHVWGKLFLRTHIGETRFREDLSIGEDMLFLLSLLPGGRTIVRTDEPLYRYTVSPAGVMERPFSPSYLDQARCWEEAERFYRENFPVLWEKETVRAHLAEKEAVSALLVAGKIAYLSKNERSAYEKETALLREKLRTYLQKKGCFAALSAGYRAKALLFLSSPVLYYGIYGKLKRKTQEKQAGA